MISNYDTFSLFYIIIGIIVYIILLLIIYIVYNKSIKLKTNFLGKIQVVKVHEREKK